MPPTKLPHSRWDELADITQRGLPAHGKPGSVLCQNIFNDIKHNIESELRRSKKLEPRRQDWITLDRLGDALAFDGVVIGVGFNQPEIVTPALKLARRLKLPKTARMLQALCPLLPPTSLRAYKPRLAWFDDPKRAPKLDKVAAMCDSCEIFKKGWFDPAMRLVLDSPSAFFDDEEGYGFNRSI
jgi:hypothetical protein